MKTVIMAGGFGTRIQEISREIASQYKDLFNGNVDIPKPMIPIDGIPVLERELECLVSQGYTDIILTVSYKHEVIEKYFADGSGVSPATGKPFNAHISYFIEEIPLGNAGALYKLFDDLSDEFLLLNADSVFHIDFDRIVQYHINHHSIVTLFTHPNSHPYDSGLIITEPDGSGVVKSWLTKEDSRPQWYDNRVNAGLHVLSKDALSKAAEISHIEIDRIGVADSETGKVYKVDLDRQILKPLCSEGVVYAYDSPEYVKDMGTPDRFYQVERDYRNGTVHAKNLQNKQKAIFLDRDGTINKYIGFLRNINQLELIDSVAEAIARINASGYLVIVVTNQPVIARGEVTTEQLNNIHKKLQTLLGEHGAYIDGLYYCPHHPDKGFEGEIPELKIQCECRKPKPGLVLKAAKDFNIDLIDSWFVGDGKNDVQCGRNAGTHTALYIGSGSDGDHRGDGQLGQEMTVDSLINLCEAIGI